MGSRTGRFGWKIVFAPGCRSLPGTLIEKQTAKQTGKHTDRQTERGRERERARRGGGERDWLLWIV